MLRSLLLTLLVALPLAPEAQTTDDLRDVRRAVLDYVEGVYEMKPELIARSVSTDMTKVGYYRPSPEADYQGIPMTYDQLVTLAETWNASGQADPETAPKGVQVTTLLDKTATARLDAQWGVDLMHLRKDDDGRWRIVHVLWQTPAPEDVARRAARFPAELTRVNAEEVTSENGYAVHTASGDPVTGLISGEYEDGTPRIRYAAVDGWVEGVWMEWHASGVPRYIGEWAGGKGEGVWTYFYDTGAIAERTGVTRDIWHGASEAWHPNGARAKAGRYEWGKKDGTWYEWNENGVLFATQVYRQGQVVEAELDFSPGQ